MTHTSAPTHQATDPEEIAAEIAALADAHGFTVAVAESLTGGQLATLFCAIPESCDWFAGSIVCFQSQVKHRVLGVPDGPVISEPAVRAMAEGATRLMDVDAVAAVSGAGGPREQEGNEPGTVWFAVLVRGVLHTELRHFDGEPAEILDQTVSHCLRMLRDAMAEHA